MSEHIDQWMAGWLKGTLGDEQREALRAHVEECEDCAEEFDRLRRDFSLMASRPSGGESGSPSAGLRQRILDDLKPEARFLDLVDDVAEILDVSAAEARRLLASVDDESNWVPVPGHDIAFFHFPFADFEPGEGVDARFTSILRVKRGSTFPEHRHIGRERVLVLQGTMLEEDGERYERGELSDHHHDTAHTFDVPEDSPDLIGIVLVERGLEIGGIPFGDA